MAKKVKRKDIDKALLDSIFNIEHEWKQISAIIDKSIEPTMDGKYKKAVAQAKYLYLLREARHRKVKAMRFD